MNRIVVEQEDLYLEDKDVIIEDFKQKDVLINIRGNVNLGIISLKNNLNLKILLDNNSKLNIDFFGEMKSSTININIDSTSNTELNFNYACVFKKDNKLNIINNVLGDNNINKIKIRTVEDNGSIVIDASGCIYENTLDNDYLEDIRAITSNNNHVKIMPNLLVKSNSVIANHNTTISNVSENSLFYLMSRGLDKDIAVSLIKDGFLKGILNINELY